MRSHENASLPCTEVVHNAFNDQIQGPVVKIPRVNLLFHQSVVHVRRIFFLPDHF